jgi:group I intron endonuclease
MVSGIYKIVNLENGKFYIGSAVNLQKRKHRHWVELASNRHHNKHLQSAWNKYGADVFVFKVIKKVEIPKLFDTESKLLRKHTGTQNCYNLGRDARAPCLGLKGKLSPSWGCKASEETKKKMSNARRGINLSIAHKQNISAGLKGKPKSQAHREKLSLIKQNNNTWRGIPKTNEFKELQKELKGIRVVVTNTDGASKVFKSIKDVNRLLGVPLPTIKRNLRSGKPISKGVFMGYTFNKQQNEKEQQDGTS